MTVEKYYTSRGISVKTYSKLGNSIEVFRDDNLTDYWRFRDAEWTLVGQEITNIEVPDDGFVIVTFHYNGGSDHNPMVFVLGMYHHNTGNRLVCGFNLHYLDEDQILKLRQHVGEFMVGKDVKDKLDKIKVILPDIVEAYRTWDEMKVSNIEILETIHP